MLHFPASLLALSLLGRVSAALVTRRAEAFIDGDATFTGNSILGGTCSFGEYAFPEGIYGTGLGPGNWAGSSKCGACLEVTGPEGTVKVMVVDSCPNCKENRLNLFADAFEIIGDPSDGIIDVSYVPVSCGMETPITVKNKEGTSKWFFSLQVLNCNFPITDLDVSTDSGRSWQPTVRQEYNYFEKEGKGGFEEDSVMIRVSCSNGRQVIIPDVSAEADATAMAPVNC